jgi:amidase
MTRVTTRIRLTVGALLALQLSCATSEAGEGRFNIVEATIPQMQEAMESGEITSRQLVEMYLQRIALYEDKVNATITVNANALVEADRMDAERKAGKVRGPLHGIPIALKDNVLTKDIPTTGGALVFEGYLPPYDATLTTNLREAGAVIIAKTVMTELANYVTNGMPGNYSAVGGQGLNPYDPRRDPREGTNDGRPVMGTGGSSSGIGTAMNFWAGNVGSETSGSILSPSNANMLVGIKPTVGRISRWGVIPITGDQDTAGPMTRTVTDAAIMLGALESASPDPNDATTSRCPVEPNRDYTTHLKLDGLKGARIGIPRANYYDTLVIAGDTTHRGGLVTERKRAMEEAIAVLKAQGAIVIDPADIPSVIDPDSANNLLRAPASSVLSYGMKRDFNAFLASLGASAPVKTLTELRAWNVAHERAGSMKYGQTLLNASDSLDLEGADKAKYEADRARDLRLTAEHGIDEVMKANNLDALLFPGSGGAGISARPGYPTVIVPFAAPVVQPTPALPEGFNLKGTPMGVSFAGMACSEGRLIELAYSFEQATKKRVPPPGMP